MATINLRYKHIDLASQGNDNLLEGVFDPSYTRPKVRKMSMYVDRDCYIVLNGDRLLIKQVFGLQWDMSDTPIHSLVMETQGVGVYAIVGY